MLFLIYLGTIIFSIVMVLCIILDICFKITNVDGYTFVKRKSNWVSFIPPFLIILLVSLIPLVNIIFACYAYSISEDVYKKTKDKLTKETEDK